jgi:hypothetical protein
MIPYRSRRLIVTLFVICLLLPFQPPARSQERAQAARKFDEFGDIAYSDKIARLDNFAIQLQNEPNTRGFIIVYRSQRDLPGLSNRYALWMKNYMVRTRGVPKERIATVDGGEAACLTQELWIAPVGAAPTPRAGAYSNEFANPDIPRKFDEHHYASAEESVDGNSYENLDAFLDAFGLALRQEPRSMGYIIAYAQYYKERVTEGDAAGNQRSYTRVHLDPQGAARKMLWAERNYLIKSFGIPPSRVKVIDGGYRTSRQVELWIVPPGANAPIPTPNQFPRGRTRR